MVFNLIVLGDAIGEDEPFQAVGIGVGYLLVGIGDELEITEVGLFLLKVQH